MSGTGNRVGGFRPLSRHCTCHLWHPAVSEGRVTQFPAFRYVFTPHRSHLRLLLKRSIGDSSSSRLFVNFHHSTHIASVAPPKKTPRQLPWCFEVEARGIEPLSWTLLTQASPCSDADCCSRRCSALRQPRIIASDLWMSYAARSPRCVPAYCS